MNFCGQCGTKSVPHARFCGECGTSIGGASPAVEPKAPPAAPVAFAEPTMVPSTPAPSRVSPSLERPIDPPPSYQAAAPSYTTDLPPSMFDPMPGDSDWKGHSVAGASPSFGKNETPSHTSANSAYESASIPGTVALWNPTVLAIWTIFLSPVFGGWLAAKNWRALGSEERARRSVWWAYYYVGALSLGSIIGIALFKTWGVIFAYLVFFWLSGVVVLL